MEIEFNHGKILPTVMENELQTSFIDYAMSVITSRALPDVRDGLKPVHRRILFSMYKNGMTPDKKHKNRPISLGTYWPNIIHMVIALCMTPWCVWLRILIFAIRW